MRERSSSQGIGGELRLALGLSFCLLLGVSALRGETLEEYQFKAAFLFNLAKFVEWPPQTFQGANDPLVSCVAGESPIGEALRRGAGGDTIGTRKLVVKPVTDIHQVAGCHILFVSSSLQKRWHSLVSAAKGEGILTVGESDDFAAGGGMVNFHLEGERIRVQINVAAVEREHLRISSRLLSLPQIVKVQGP
jgi:hypothetical protein